jgi:hypothetical protein
MAGPGPVMVRFPEIAGSELPSVMVLQSALKTIVSPAPAARIASRSVHM